MEEERSVELEKLINRGISGIKPYVPGRSIEEVVRERNVKNIIKMASNENPLGMSPKAYNAIITALKASYHYPEVTGMRLREALGEKFDMPPEYIITGNGADEIIYTIAMTFLDEGDEVIIPGITFSMYEIVSRAMRAKILKAPMDPIRGLRIDLSSMKKLISERTKMLFICNPNNPTGDLLTGDELFAFLYSIPKNIIVVHDECYSEFADPNRFPDLREMIRNGQENLILLRTFSKIYGLAGIRIGYGLAHPEMLKLMYRIRPPFGVSIPAQEAGIAALEDTEFYEQTLSLNSTGKRFIYDKLEELGLQYVESHTNFILLDTGFDSLEVSDRMISRGIIIRPMASYGLPTYIRVTIGLREHNLRFIDALKEVLEELKGE